MALVKYSEIFEHVVRESVEDGSSMIGFPLLIADSGRDMLGILPGPLGWHTSTLITELQEVSKMCVNCIPMLILQCELLYYVV